MNCDTARGHLLDAVYGEDVPIQTCFLLFKHMEGCPDCEGEFRELTETRERLGLWQLEETELSDGRDWVALPAQDWKSRAWTFVSFTGPLLQKVAAAILILVGGFTILQNSGLVGRDRVTVSEQQLLEMVNDMIVLRQAEERKIIGQALVSFADEMDLKQRMSFENMTAQVQSMELRYLENLEETNRYLRTLLTR